MWRTKAVAPLFSLNKFNNGPVPNEVRDMNLKTRIFMVVIAAALVCGIQFAADAMAQNNGEYNQNYTTQMTPEQQTALQQILKEHSDVAGQIEEAINAKRGELLALIDSPNPDRARIASLSRELGDLRGQLLTARVDMKAKLAQAGIPAYHTQADRNAWRSGYNGCPAFRGCPAFNGWNGGWGHHGGYHGNWMPMMPMMGW